MTRKKKMKYCQIDTETIIIINRPTRVVKKFTNELQETIKNAMSDLSILTILFGAIEVLLKETVYRHILF